MEMKGQMKMNITRWLMLGFIMTVPLLAGPGCAAVKPWEQMNFGTYLMRSDRDPVETQFKEHVYFTREAASGGASVGGGGCGCN